MKYYELTKEQIKAIRIIKGYNPDLRTKIKVAYEEEVQGIMNLIIKNSLYLLGIDAKLEIQKLTYGQQEKIYNNLVMQVTGGEDR